MLKRAPSHTSCLVSYEEILKINCELTEEKAAIGTKPDGHILDAVAGTGIDCTESAKSKRDLEH